MRAVGCSSAPPAAAAPASSGGPAAGDVRVGSARGVAPKSAFLGCRGDAGASRSAAARERVGCPDGGAPAGVVPFLGGRFSASLFAGDDVRAMRMHRAAPVYGAGPACRCAAAAPCLRRGSHTGPAPRRRISCGATTAVPRTSSSSAAPAWMTRRVSAALRAEQAAGSSKACSQTGAALPTTRSVRTESDATLLVHVTKGCGSFSADPPHLRRSWASRTWSARTPSRGRCCGDGAGPAAGPAVLPADMGTAAGAARAAGGNGRDRRCSAPSRRGAPPPSSTSPPPFRALFSFFGSSFCRVFHFPSLCAALRCRHMY